MTALDMVLLLVLGLMGAIGFARGLAHEVVTVAAWIAGLCALYMGVGEGAKLLAPYLGSPLAARILAAALTFALGYGAVRLAGGWIVKRLRASAAGPVDRVLGFGFGVGKGMLIASLAFLMGTMVYDIAFLGRPRPAWLTEARFYPLLRATGETLTGFVPARSASSVQGLARPAQGAAR